MNFLSFKVSLQEFNAKKIYNVPLETFCHVQGNKYIVLCELILSFNNALIVQIVWKK